MAARLGNVLYWLGCLVAAFFSITPLLAACNFAVGHHHRIYSDNVLAVSTGLAVGSWVIGRALRYILAGT
jgi:hypothetical protein